MTMAGSVGKASRKEEKEREQVNADSRPLVRLSVDSQSSALLSVALADDTTTDDKPSPLIANPNPNPNRGNDKIAVG
ncbi:hypothetical protein BLNAU_7424 [Blattamonas nauphoetae]|uniref:Uncharacterized protein n=1 Tax=Blattamonas nauphoetae TaxID=2049346 RepID=A0ABQ9Y1B8_9EUKA|nr:hypothetical protein BLNAU_7424 [Blattamonas nauphoetae]